MKHNFATTLLLFCFTSVLTCGCTMLGPDFQRPEAEIAEQWQESDNNVVKKMETDDSQWWKLFNDPVLDELIRLSYEQNLSLEIAGLRVLEARAQLGIVTGNLYPQVQELGGDLYDNGVPQPTQDRNFNSASVGFDSSWEVDFWGKFRRSIQSADANLAATVAGYDDTLVSLTGEVARTYVQLRTLEERIILAGKNAKIQEMILSIVQVQFNNGTVTELDLQQARTQLYSTKAMIPGFQLSLDQAKHSLSILMGMPPGDLSNILQNSGIIPDAPAEVVAGIPADLLRRRPDIRQAEMQAAAQSEQIGIARAELYPNFSLIGSLGWSSTNSGDSSLGDIFDKKQFGLTFGPSFSWKIFNYGRLKNQVRVEDARLEQLLITYQNTVLNAAQEVEDAMSGFLNSRIKEQYLKMSMQAAQRSQDLSMLQYKEGLIDYSRVLDSTTALTAQQDNYTATQGDVVTYLIAMYKALGGGWQVRIGRDFVPETTMKEMEMRTDWGELLEMPSEEPTNEPPTESIRKPDW